MILNYVQEINIAASVYISSEIWNTLEIIVGILVVYGCILQRIRADIFKESGSSKYYKLGQLGLFIQMMLGIITCIDGYSNIAAETIHPILIFWGISSILMKYQVFVSNKASKDKMAKI